MTKKYIDVNGQKYYRDEKDADGGDTPVPEAPATPVATPAEPVAPAAPEAPAEPVAPATPEAVEAKAKEMGKTIAKEILAEINVDKSTESNAKIATFLNGKDLTNKEALTPEEKIVGFYHALMTDDRAVLKALSEGTAADGGFLFPDEFRAELIKTLVGPFTMRGLVRVVPMKNDVMNIPSVASRPKVTWTAENATKSTTTAHFAQITLTARKVAAILYASDELVEDSNHFDVVKLIIDLFADALRDEEDKVILQGNGTTQPTGLLTAVTAGTITARTTAGNLDFNDLIDTYYDLGQRYRQNAKWIVATANVRELRKIKDSDGKYIWQESVKDGEPARMLGKDVIENDYLGEATILFGDYKLGYWLGDRKKMTVKVSNETETAFTKDQTAIRVVQRIGGNVVLAEAMRALNVIP